MAAAQVSDKPLFQFEGCSQLKFQPGRTVTVPTNPLPQVKRSAD